MNKEYMVDIMVDTEGTKVPTLGKERYFHKDSSSTLGSKVNYEVAK